MIYVAILNIFIYINILIFPIMFLFIINYFFFHLFTESLVVYLIGYMHKFFDLYLWFFYVKNRVEKFNIKFIWLCIDVFNLIIILIIFLIFPIMFLFIVDYFFVFHLSTQLLVAYLIRCMNKFFDLHLRFF